MCLLRPLRPATKVATDKPNNGNTVAEIKSWLNQQGVEYPSSANKSELLTIVEEN